MIMTMSECPMAGRRPFHLPMHTIIGTFILLLLIVAAVYGGRDDRVAHFSHLISAQGNNGTSGLLLYASLCPLMMVFSVNTLSVIRYSCGSRRITRFGIPPGVLFAARGRAGEFWSIDVPAFSGDFVERITEAS